LRVVAVLLVVVLILGLLSAVGGAYALSALAERTIPGNTWGLEEFVAYGQLFTITKDELDEAVELAVEPYALDMVDNPTFDFQPPEVVEISADLSSARVRLQGHLLLRDGVPQVYLERLNGVPLYVVGGIVSNGINRGLDELFDQASFRLETLEVQTAGIAVQAEGELVPIAVPTRTPRPRPTSTLRPSPTAPPTKENMGTLTIVNEVNEPLTIELDGEERAMAVAEELELELPVDSYPYVLTVDAPGYKPQRGTLRVVKGNNIFRVNLEPEPTPVARTKATPTVRPTRAPSCPDRHACITAPGIDVRVQGEVTIWGTGDIANFDYYKMEIGAGSYPRSWAVLGELHHSPVSDDVLAVWNSDEYPEGVYILRLIVVDKTGNYKTSQTRVNVSR
jgi:hypothetical protein